MSPDPDLEVLTQPWLQETIESHFLRGHRSCRDGQSGAMEKLNVNFGSGWGLSAPGLCTSPPSPAQQEREKGQRKLGGGRS